MNVEIEVAKQLLEKALLVVGPGLAKESDISGHFVFRARDGKTEVLTSNNRVFGSCPIDCPTVDDGGFTIEAKRLKQWLRSVSDAALTLKSNDDGEVTAISPEGQLPFQSLDPSTFPYWDKLLKGIEKADKKRTAALEAEDENVPPPVKFQIEANRLASALGYAKNFISDQETVDPHLCVAEMVNGHMMATNKAAATVVKIQGLEESTLRIHRADIQATISFLALSGSETIEVLESDRAVVFQRQDGSRFGVSRTNDAFPDLNLNQFAEVKHWWELSPTDVTSTIQFVKSAADWADNDINVDDEGDSILLWMPAFHSKKRAKRQVQCVDRAKDDEGNVVGTVEPFRINLDILTTVLGSWKSPTVRFDLYPPSKHRRGGFIRGQEDRKGDTYSTILTFLR